METLATTTTDFLTNTVGVYLVATALGITLGSVIMIVWLVLKGRKGDAYASLNRHD